MFDVRKIKKWVEVQKQDLKELLIFRKFVREHVAPQSHAALMFKSNDELCSIVDILACRTGLLSRYPTMQVVAGLTQLLNECLRRGLSSEAVELIHCQLMNPNNSYRPIDPKDPRAKRFIEVSAAAILADYYDHERDEDDKINCIHALQRLHFFVQHSEEKVTNALVIAINYVEIAHDDSTGCSRGDPTFCIAQHLQAYIENLQNRRSFFPLWLQIERSREPLDSWTRIQEASMSFAQLFDVELAPNVEVFRALECWAQGSTKKECGTFLRSLRYDSMKDSPLVARDILSFRHPRELQEPQRCFENILRYYVQARLHAARGENFDVAQSAINALTFAQQYPQIAVVRSGDNYGAMVARYRSGNKEHEEQFPYWAASNALRAVVFFAERYADDVQITHLPIARELAQTRSEFNRSRKRQLI